MLVVYGAQFVMIHGTTVMLKLYVDNLDTVETVRCIVFTACSTFL